MAKKFFNQKIKKSKKTTMTKAIALSIIAILILIIVVVVIILNIQNRHNNAVVKMRDVVAVEVNSELPDKTLFFSELEHVKEKDIKISYKNVDIKELGKYTVDIKIYGKKYKGTLEVIDTESPELKLKNLSIPVGTKYKPEDFVESCTDNSEKECKISFYTLGMDQNGKNIDYSSFTAEGKYNIQIVATDAANNSTTAISTELTIGAAEDIKPIKCKYGNNEYDTGMYNLAVDVSQNNCALDLNLYQDDNILAPVKRLINSEKEKLNKEFSKINLNTKDIYLNTNIGPVLNKSGSGIVGYTLFIEVSLKKNGQAEIIESYYVNLDGSRNYTINKYLK